MFTFLAHYNISEFKNIYTKTHTQINTAEFIRIVDNDVARNYKITLNIKPCF